MQPDGNIETDPVSYLDQVWTHVRASLDARPSQSGSKPCKKLNFKSYYPNFQKLKILTGCYSR